MNNEMKRTETDDGTGNENDTTNQIDSERSGTGAGNENKTRN